MNFIVKYAALYTLLSSPVILKGYTVSRNATSKRQYVEVHFDNGEETNNSKVSFGAEHSSLCSSTPDVDTTGLFPKLKFNASWISKKYFWLSDDYSFESNYYNHFENLVQNEELVKVFVVPHSHTDPGWLATYEQYYYTQVKHILDNAVRKLTQLPFMTFVWSEITYLGKWWKDANTVTRQRFKRLVDEGRLEIVSGGWVVPDEATNSLFALMAELTEGHQWVKNQLNVTAEYGWAIDPFGHSATHSHLLKSSGLKGMVIQRLHYVWKHWLAEHKMVDFTWRPRWDAEGDFDIPCLTLPFDLYSIKHACGPEPQVCLKFDFRSVAFEYGENYGLMTPISKATVRKSSEEIVAQYHKTAALTRHNVILVPLGDDFRYDRPLEWEQQYSNYMQLFSYVNSHPDKYRMEIRFGTVRDYFETLDQLETEKKVERRPSLSGDFFPYGDVYVNGKPSYWTGFYGTRPYWKRFHRELENELRSAEILFTYANSMARQAKAIVEMKGLSYKYMDLTKARKEFSVFTHHDGITGTSRRWTMEDYGDRMHSAYQTSISVQIQSLKILHKLILRKTFLPMSKPFMRERFEQLPEMIPLEVFRSEEYVTCIMIFNSLGWPRTELVKVFVKDLQVLVQDGRGQHIPSQINPVFILDEKEGSIELSERMFELVFLATMDALSFANYKIIRAKEDDKGASVLATVSCSNCTNLNESLFTNENVRERISIENSETRIHFQRNGLLDKIDMKTASQAIPVALSFGLYKPVNRFSGAYLLKPILTPEWKFFNADEISEPHVIKIIGPIMSQVVSIHSSNYETIKVNTTLINQTSASNINSLRVDTYVDFSRDSSNRAEIFMRLDTGIRSSSENLNNSLEVSPHVMYTDQNGLVSEKRIFVPSIDYEANTYPVTTTAYIQENDSFEKNQTLRFSVLVDRTHGFCSTKPGRLETLIERKSLYDDGRGMSEGVTDSRPTVSSYIFLLEQLQGHRHSRVNPEAYNNDENTFSWWQPTVTAHTTSLKLNYPPNLFVYHEPNDVINLGGQANINNTDTTLSLIAHPLPEHVHLLNWRTLSNSTVKPNDNPNLNNYNNNNKDNEEYAGAWALINLQYLPGYGSQCKDKADYGRSQENEVKDIIHSANYLNISKLEPTSLTGISEGYVVYNDAHGKQASPLLANFKMHFN